MYVRIRSTGIRFDKLKLVSERTMRDLGDMAVNEIVTRTERGVDYQNRPFQAYSEGYAERKAGYRGGLLGAGVGVGTVNLRGIGPGLRMLDAVGTTSVGPRRVVIGFLTAAKAKLAFFHVESGAGLSHVIRDFFGLSQRFLDRSVATIKSRWK